MNGIVVIDKPAGCTSHDVVAKVKRILRARKAGHLGTLDPMATGVLPVCVNEATKLAQFLSVADKTYRAVMLLGMQTDTQDTEGKITDRCELMPRQEEIIKTLAGFAGKIKQLPPAFSAVKYKGKPLYRYARAGEFPERTVREVEVFDLKVREIDYPHVTFDIVCSAGTYIRTICSDAGQALGCGACLCRLRRVKSGPFTESMAVSLVAGEGEEKRKELLDRMLSMQESVPYIPAVVVDDSTARRLRDGFQPDAHMLRHNVHSFLVVGDMIKFTGPNGELVALAEMQMPAVEISRGKENTQAARLLRVFK